MRPNSRCLLTRRSSALPWSVVLAAFLAASAAQAQTRFEDVRLVVGRHGQSMVRNPGLTHVEGTLTIDPQARRLRFDAPAEPSREIAFDAIVALHYEESSFPRRAFGRRTPYLAVHHTAANGEPDLAILRLPGESRAEILSTLERATGRAIDRTESTTSFAGLPIHAGVGDVVYLTDLNGQRTKGTIVGLGVSSIDLGPGGSFEAAAVRQIDVADPIWGGVIVGAFVAFLPAAAITVKSCTGGASTSCHQWGLLTPAGWGVVLAGAGIGGLFDAARMRHAYRRPDGSGSPSLRWNLLLGGDAKGVQVRFRF